MDSTTVTPISSPSMSKFRKRSDSVGTAGTTEDECAVPIQRSKTIYSPLVSSMIQSNSLRDCQQIHSMMMQCQMDSTSYNNSNRGNSNTTGSSSEPFVCRTAKKYHAMCLSGERL